MSYPQNHLLRIAYSPKIVQLGVNIPEIFHLEIWGILFYRFGRIGG